MKKLPTALLTVSLALSLCARSAAGEGTPEKQARDREVLLRSVQVASADEPDAEDGADGMSAGHFDARDGVAAAERVTLEASAPDPGPQATPGTPQPRPARRSHHVRNILIIVGINLALVIGLAALAK